MILMKKNYSIFFFHRRSRRLEISTNKTQRNDMDDANAVSYFELVSEDQLQIN